MNNLPKTPQTLKPHLEKTNAVLALDVKLCQLVLKYFLLTQIGVVAFLEGWNHHC